MGPPDGELRRYLLGGLPETVAEGLEERYLADAGLLERIRGEEIELVDDYVAGRLASTERQAFERHYLASAEHRGRVAVAQALARVARGEAAAVPPWRRRRLVQVGLAAAAGLLAVLGVERLTRPPRPAGAPAVASAPAPVPEPAAPPLAPPPPARRPVVAAFTLSPLLLRGSGAPGPLRVATEAEEVLLRLEGEERLPEPLTFTLRTVAGELVASGSASAPPPGASRSLVATVALPAPRLRPDDYVLTLSGGAGDVALRYAFRVADRR